MTDGNAFWVVYMTDTVISLINSRNQTLTSTVLINATVNYQAATSVCVWKPLLSPVEVQCFFSPT